MVRPRLFFTFTLFCFCYFEWLSEATRISTFDKIPVSESKLATNEDVKFFASRGRRSSGNGGRKSGGGSRSSSDYFWANRGKRSVEKDSSDEHDDDGVSRFNSKGLFFHEKRSFNAPRPNGFFFPSALSGEKRNGYNIPKPNGFFFPQIGKRAGVLNIPSPNGLMFPLWNFDFVGDKRSSPVMAFNMPRPNGFLFPSNIGKRSHDTDYIEAENDYEDGLVHLYIPPYPMQPLLPENEPTYMHVNVPNEEMFPVATKRGDFNSDTFFAGRGKRNLDSEQPFYTSSIKIKKGIGRGKKAEQVGDIFFAGRGKRHKE